MGEEISADVMNFFKHGKLLKQLKCTFITLIPKVDNPVSPSDFCPIYLTNELYKIIARIIA